MKLKQMAIILLGLMVAFATQQAWLDVHLPQPVEVLIAKGMSSTEIARLLKRQGVIRSAFEFRLLTRASGAAEKLQSGQYSFEKAIDLWDVLQRLKQGDVVLHHITVPEGLRVDEILTLLADRTDISLGHWQESLKELTGGGEVEGTLMPETYTYRTPLQPGDILGPMLKANRERLSELTPTWLTADQLLVVASIIEKETSKDSERPLIAAVIRNRLQKRMFLQMDPTVIYGLWRTDGSFSGNLKKRDMERDTPWNTYTRKGLPPTPICNPGIASLQAAARPADIDHLYFVADGSGGHVFASSLESHRVNVRKWLAITQQRKAK